MNGLTFEISTPSVRGTGPDVRDLPTYGALKCESACMADDSDGLFNPSSLRRSTRDDHTGDAARSTGPGALPPPGVDSRAIAMRKSRNRFIVQTAPSSRMSSNRAFPEPSSMAGPPPAGVEAVANWFEHQPAGRQRFRWALRDSLDELMDGQRTGRWCYQHLSKTEKTYLGTAVEINLTKEFFIPAGDDLDWKVAGAELDCKFSKDLAGWEIPMEMYVCADHADQSGNADHPALLVWLDDDRGRWAAGVLQISDELLRWKSGGGQAEGERVRAYNRDNKRKVSDPALPLIRWLWGGVQTDLPTNLLLHLDPAARQRIFSAADGRLGSGQKRINQLFKEVTGRIVGRQTVLTVAQQDDAPKRARDARLLLRPEGYLVLGHQESHPHIAHLLRLTVPVKGEWISVRVAEVDAEDTRPKAFIQGSWWSAAQSSDPTTAAPLLDEPGLTHLLAAQCRRRRGLPI